MNGQLKRNIQKAFKTPELDEQKKAEFLKKVPQPPISMWQFILIQAAYLRKRTWVFSLLLLFPSVIGACHIGYETLWITSAIVPFLGLLAVAENNRSITYGMSEFELSTRFSLKSVVLARMSIFGVLDFIILACLVPLCWIGNNFSFIQTGTYIVVPYLLTVNLSLWVTRHIHSREAIYDCCCISVRDKCRASLYGKRDIYPFLFWLVACLCFFLDWDNGTRNILHDKTNGGILMELSIDRLTKQYQNKIAVDRISLRLNTGIYGLLGANGAGKTTLMRMVCGILKPTSGTITFDGIDVSEERYRSMLGYLPQDFGYYPEFTGEDFLLYMAALKGMRKPQARRKTVELLKLVSLHDVAKKKIKTYSGGMKQRLGIAQALLNQPKLLVLDEPTAGLDPKERVRFRDLIKDLGKDSIVLLSTHIVSDIEHIADDILMMKSGQLIYQGKWTDKSGNLEEFYLKQFEEIE